MIRPGQVGRFWLPPILYCGLIFLQSSFPVPVKTPAVPYLDKAVHVLIYGPLAILFCRAWQSLPGFQGRLKLVCWLGFGATVLYGASDEWHQSFVPGRSADVMDLLADALGALIGVWLYATVRTGGSKQRQVLPGGGD